MILYNQVGHITFQLRHRARLNGYQTMPGYLISCNVSGSGCVATQAGTEEDAREKFAQNGGDDFLGENLEYTVTEIQNWEDRELD
jgi:hypothetical protein